MNIFNQPIYAFFSNTLAAGMEFKCLIDFICPRDLPRFYRQIMTHKTVKIFAVTLLTKGDFHWTSVIFIQPGLMLWFEAHQNKIAHQIGLT